MGSHLCILHLRAFFLIRRAVASYQEGVARALRIERAGAWYHVTARGNERRAIYRDQRDRRHFCELLGETVVRFRLVLHAYALMENHFHLLVQTLEPNLGAAMRWLNVSYRKPAGSMSNRVCGRAWLRVLGSGCGRKWRWERRRSCVSCGRD